MPQRILALLPLLAALALCLAAVTAHLTHKRGPRLALSASSLATWLALLVAALSASLLVAQGPATSPLLGRDGVGLSVRLDAVSAIMFTLIAFIGLVVARFSRNYLAGDPRHGSFMAWLCWTLAAVQLLVTAGNTVHLALAWVATSLTLHRLLTFYPDRPRARIAARKKFWVARLGDTCLVVAVGLLWQAFGTTDLATLLERVSASPASLLVGAAAVLLACAALLKSAQFPTHGWLTEVMETPTPVSALLHAGIVNAGGFLVVRMASVVAVSDTAMHLLAAIGALTALYGSAAMLPQTSVKTALAFSTVAQMGFMLFECGIGAFSIALLHIVAHSLYKAHAFLSSGSTVDALRQAAFAPSRTASPAAVVASVLLFASAACAAVVAAASSPWAVTLTLTAIVTAGAVHLAARRLLTNRGSASALAGAASAAVLVVSSYLLLETGIRWITATALPPLVAPDPTTTALMVATLIAFTALAGAQWLVLGHGSHPLVRSAYVHLRHGLYANVLFDRLVGALKLTPVRNDAHTTETHS